MARSPERRGDYARDNRRDDRDRYRDRSRDRRHDDRDRSRDRDRDRDRRDWGSDRVERRHRDDRSYRGDYSDRDRDRSRDRRHQSRRHPSPVRDHRDSGRRRPREGDDRHGNGDRNPKRMRTDSQGRSETSSRPGTSNGDARKAASVAEDEAQKKAQAEKLAKVEAWKAMKSKRPAAEQSAATPPSVSSSAGMQQDSTSSEPAPRSKFDPKAIKKQIGGKTKVEMATLGSDAAIPARVHKTPANTRLPVAAAHGAGDAKITGFGLNKAPNEKQADKSNPIKAGNALDEDEGEQRKFRKLPDLALEATDDTPITATENESHDDDGDHDDLRSDEEEAEAARQAAQKRAEELQAEEQDAAMPDADGAVIAAVEETGAMDVDEDVDPLDAFMNDLDQAIERPTRKIAPRSNREPQLFDEDEGPGLDAVGDNPEDLLKGGGKRNKKEILPVDHSKVDYEDFEKNFYRESVEVSAMTEDDVTTLRAELDNITVRGLDQPKPITKWSQCGFGAQILDVIKSNKFEAPTSIQSQALPAIMSGRDTIGIAKTGSGKTLAFTLPMFRHIKDQRPVANLEGPIGLIMAPTRELAVQIHRECKPYLKALNLRGVCAYGGAPIKDQIAELKRGAEVVVCTPGRLIDLLAANQGRVTNLKRVTYVVLDEADRMFDMGFEPQIQRVLGNIRPDRQTVLFSATFPKKMESLARKALTRPIEIVVGGRSVVAAEITQIIEVRAEDTKFRRVLELLGNLHEHDEEARSLIFVERQETADHLFKELHKKGYPSVSVHGGREQIDRDQAILDFKAGAIPIMVATSVAARGLDVKQLKLVVNFDSPNHGEDYVHRAGRTGRAGNTGTAVTFITPEQEHYAPFLVRCLEDSKQEIPEDLKGMAASHKKKVEAGQASKAGSGFGGHGIEKLDAARAAERAREKNLYKTGDEPEDEDDGKKEKDKKETEVEKLVAKAAGKVTERDTQPEQPEAKPQGGEGMSSDLAAHLSNALKVKKTEKPAADAPVLNDPVARAAAAAAAINGRLGTKGATRPGAPIDNRGPDAGAFHSTLEINDFPQKARWGVTNRTNVAKILEATGTSITSKGEYYAPGKEVGPNDPPKLYILVEGDTEIAVQSAMRELSRHLTEGTVQAQEAEARTGGGGRYKVI
ncbi:Putative ATP-dependent RNA helicase DEAD-box, Helicase superfamily 1/2, ATP-binding protein [Septoria linicola]|uniref:RNA helicase n=1 Tax=Septoria linicola TaxID=215465 RepID=A0A9Q9AN46_9PEZI|nr:putative ATP-dependent RNA helicase DEAD-box, Helicase superfamily 1/2, ATP-binding protein [Septoria linicola]USW47801.1 Putative ATP-dependent RNA helicase DEAD-box, Helicase superfamily 1/2, ATP-binding protein [Septoria linicola]